VYVENLEVLQQAVARRDQTYVYEPGTTARQMLEWDWLWPRFWPEEL
jgi:hypothetical protein